jgi:hypothetical protein
VDVGEDAADEERCAPIAFESSRDRLMSRQRSAVSPWVDCRNEFDKARDRIEELADVVSCQFEQRARVEGKLTTVLARWRLSSMRFLLLAVPVRFARR